MKMQTYSKIWQGPYQWDLKFITKSWLKKLICSSAEYRALRSIIIDMVLATEMSKHFEHLNKFVNKFCENESKQMIVSSKRRLKPALWLADNLNCLKDKENLKLPENKLLIRRILIKCADVNNPAKPLYLCEEWATRIANEYFEQVPHFEFTIH